MIGPVPDVRGVARPGPIDGLGDLPSTWRRPIPGGRPSRDAGTYLCNFALRRALLTFPRAEVGFLHVVPFSRTGYEVQLAIVRALIEPR